MKKAIILFVLFIVIPLCLFADRWFTMNINYTASRTCQLQFWPTNSTSNSNSSSVDVSSIIGTDSSFARLGIVYTGTNVVSVDIGYTPFYAVTTVNGDRQFSTAEAYPYSLTISPQGSNTSSWFVSNGVATSTSETLEYGGYAAQVSFSKKRIISSKNPNQIGESISSSQSLIANLGLTDVDLGNSGEYISFLMCFLTVE